MLVACLREMTLPSWASEDYRGLTGGGWLINILRPFMFRNRNRPNNGLVVGYPRMKL